MEVVTSLATHLKTLLNGEEVEKWSSVSIVKLGWWLSREILHNFASIATSVFVLDDSLPGVAEMRTGEHEEEIACLTGRSRSRMIESPLLASSSFSGDHLCIQCSVSVEPVAQIAGI